MLYIFDFAREMNTLAVAFRLVLAVLCGGLIGIEREYKRRPAGFRTHILICLGAAMTTLTSQYMFLTMHLYTDVARLGAQVIAGIGFIGAGTIIVTGRREVKGLTTAAGLWASACMGLAIGAGFYECMLISFLLIVMSMKFLPYIENLIMSKAVNMSVYIEVDNIENLGSVLGFLKREEVRIYEVELDKGVRLSKITGCADDIALSLGASGVRIAAVPGKISVVGIEVPNRAVTTVSLREVIDSPEFAKAKSKTSVALGKSIDGSCIVGNIARMPHLLIAGTTGSGKSVMINSIITTLLMRALPEDVRLIMVDPKRVELAGYNGLPHLYVPVVTEPKQAASALQWAVSEMERRLKVFERLNVRKISTYNEKQAAGEFEHYDNPPQKMPYLVIIIDELSDLMMVAGKDVEASIVRIAQLGRAAGIHLIVATQRPSSNVVTGLIKANITNRIAFNVATGIDSRVIIDQMGAEKLTGLGDMLFSKVDWGKPRRIQGCFVSDDEINEIVEFVKSQSEPDYHEEILSAVAPASMSMAGGGGIVRTGVAEPQDDDPLIWEAAHIVVESQLGSTSGLQRRLKVGYARAGRIMDMLEEKGVVGPPDGSKPREVLLDEEGLAALESVDAEMAREDREFGGF